MDKTFTKILSKYIDFVDILSPKLVAKLSKLTKINNYIIELVNNWQTLYDPIYGLGFIKLEMLKTYIKNNLANSFIKSFKTLAKSPIFFNKKLNRSSRLYINYCSLNNIIIKNWYLLPLVRKLLDQLNQA